MATIKTTKIEALMPDPRNRITGHYWKWYTWETFIDNKGNTIYKFNDEECTKEYGNERFVEIKKLAKEIKREDKTEELTYQEIIDRLEKGIDQYVQYIDDPGQYREACNRNQEIRNKVSKIRKLMEEEEAS